MVRGTTAHVLGSSSVYLMGESCDGREGGEGRGGRRGGQERTCGCGSAAQQRHAMHASTITNRRAMEYLVFINGHYPFRWCGDVRSHMQDSEAGGDQAHKNVVFNINRTGNTDKG